MKWKHLHIHQKWKNKRFFFLKDRNVLPCGQIFKSKQKSKFLLKTAFGNFLISMLLACINLGEFLIRIKTKTQNVSLIRYNCILTKKRCLKLIKIFHVVDIQMKIGIDIHKEKNSCKQSNHFFFGI